MNKDKINYIAAIFQLDIKNPYILQDLINHMEAVDFNQFRAFYNQYSNYAGAEYQRGFDKFLFYIKLFKRFNTDNSSKLDYYESLAKKVKFIGYNAIGLDIDFKNVKIKDTGEHFFTSEDINILTKIGTLRQCIRLQKSVSGADALLDAMRERIENDNTSLQIANISKEVISILPKARAA